MNCLAIQAHSIFLGLHRVTLGLVLWYMAVLEISTAHPHFGFYGYWFIGLAAALQLAHGYYIIKLVLSSE